MSKVFHPDYDFYTNLPGDDIIINPLTDVPVNMREESELIEFYKLCNEHFSPAFGIKYLLGTNLYPFQMAIIMSMLRHKFPLLLLSRGSGKSFILAVFAAYAAVFFPGIKIILISAGFRQSKLIFNEIKRIWDRAPLLQAMSNGAPAIGVGECHFYVNGSSIIALPLGQGDKIRGQRAHITLADEINSIPPDIFDIVVRGFAATEMDPWEKTKTIMTRDKIQTLDDGLISTGNKIILSGTAGFRGEPLYRMFKQYSTILAHKIDGYAMDYSDELGIEQAGEEQIDYRDYCVVRMKYTDLPPGMMDVKIIHNAKATMSRVFFDMEYNTIFADDSVGFYKQKDINNATSSSPDGFSTCIVGHPKRQYVIGVDPARTADRASICVIELGTPNKNRYLWTCQGQKYSFLVSKLRELIRSFQNVIGIAIDLGGGGLAVQDLLAETSLMLAGDRPIFSHDDESEEAKQGARILHMINFAPAWIDEANALLQKNIEDKVLMFPMLINPGNIYEDVKMADALEDALYEISEMKKELVSIEVTYNKNGTRRYDLAPATASVAPGEVPRHKDRYSSLLLANYLVSKFTILNFDEKEELRKKYNQSPIGGWMESFGK